ncbi:Gamma-tubulin complex component 6 [Ananas comosus]|uniref:Gamma-tubulin complex component 6 n=1 Tax=Ananas comosus TaxID=4615 RepID=A0A199VWI9_ANACO|nr:Gamma-tubulin complex component 6 [Ananas comosus]
MEIDPNLSSVLRNLKVDDPWTPPRTWESIPSESGAPRSGDPRRRSRAPIYDPASVSDEINYVVSTIIRLDIKLASWKVDKQDVDATLVRLALLALQGVKSAIVEIEEISSAFCSSPADRTSHRVPNLWCRSSSTNALGQILKSINHTALVVYFLQKFVNFYLFSSRKVAGESRNKIDEDEVSYDNNVEVQPPYSLVNHAFSVAVKKVLEGYFCSLSTLLASVKLRRLNAPSSITKGKIGKTTTVSEVTILEVYLHTEELRRLIQSLGNICFPKFADLDLWREDLNTDTNFEFHNFPKGADLLSYLYVQFRDADPINCELIKYLFIRSCEPYCGFIKSWIYRASIDDPYEEFLVAHSDTLQTANGAIGSRSDLPLMPSKERSRVSVPCFLKDVCRPLLLAGLQLQVLVRLLNLSGLSIVGGAHIPRDLANLEEILPFWFDYSSNSAFLSNSMTFSKKRMETILHKREAMYKTMSEKLQLVFSKYNVRYQWMDHAVNAANFLGKKNMNFPAIWVPEVDSLFPATASEEATICMASDQEDANNSYASDESSCEVEKLQSSECSSSCSSTEETEVEEIAILGSNITHSNLSSCYASISGFTNSRNERLYSSQNSLYSNQKETSPTIAAQVNNEDEKPNEFSIPSRSDENYQYGCCWPFDRLLKNPINSNLHSTDSEQVASTEDTPCTTAGNMDSLRREESISGEVLLPFSLIGFINGKNQPELPCKHYDFSANPMVAKATWRCTNHGSREKRSMKNLFPCFDFSSVANPCEVYSETVFSRPANGSQVETPLLKDSGVSTCNVYEKSNDSVQDNTGGQAVSSFSLSQEAKYKAQNLPKNAPGGAHWAGLLRYSGEDVKCTGEDSWHGEYEMPLDVAIDKCIVHEILLQYKYISNFTIKLLEERFDLCEHLLALRRYHFMELADWTDSFIICLRHQKWSTVGPDQKIAGIQGLLQLALQRSSCESDPYKERLFVYMKGLDIVPPPTSSTGLSVLDYILLGYKVDWPISIIITEDALKIYAEIFGYLIQVRLAVFSLTDTWRNIKELLHSIRRCQQVRPEDVKDFNTLVRVRQQIYHFVSTLQQYVHSQLSGVSWCRFQHSLKHQVKDMLDLETMHMSYLADALHICFLSAETKSILAIIKNILQCALDLCLCFSGLNLDDGSKADHLNLQSRINFSQVFAINTMFERNIKDLYLLYLKSPKYGEFGLCRFWNLLNYNDHYSTAMGNSYTGFIHL